MLWKNGVAAVIGFALATAFYPAAARARACASQEFDGARYVVCSFDARRDEIRTFWRGADGKPYRGFDALAEALHGRGRVLAFAMNAGMFEEDGSPVGLYLEDGKRLKPADLREGATNFHLKPNGVFWIGAGSAGVLETSRYLANPPAAKYATQSGPMLVIDGRIHPKIQPTGLSLKMRNGVCVRDGTNVMFAISEEEVTFHAFARLFRDGLACANALFLDGTVSSLYAPELSRNDELFPLGPIVAVTAPAQ